MMNKQSLVVGLLLERLADSKVGILVKGINGIQPDEIAAELPGIPLGRLGTGADSAGAILWLATQSGSYVTGQLININGGMDFT